MPKLSKRKRQLKEIHSRRGDEGDEADEEENEQTEEVSTKEVPKQATNGKSSRIAQKQAATAAANAAAAAAAASTKSGDGTKEDDRVWVQCNACDKWRSLPSTVDASKLPEIWNCKDNIYDSNRNSCDAPEENYTKEEEDQDYALKSFLRGWVKRLRNADRAENRLTAISTRGGKKRKQDVEWIQCSSPSCGKWRAISRGIESANLIKRLNKNKRFGGEFAWYCSMNPWDDSTASCAAPQEPLFNCRWNLAKEA